MGHGDTKTMGQEDIGTLEQNIGTPEHMDIGTQGHCDTGTLVQRNNGTIGQDNGWGEGAGAHLPQPCYDFLYRIVTIRSNTIGLCKMVDWQRHSGHYNYYCCYFYLVQAQFQLASSS